MQMSAILGCKRHVNGDNESNTPLKTALMLYYFHLALECVYVRACVCVYVYICVCVCGGVHLFKCVFVRHVFIGLEFDMLCYTVVVCVVV